MRGYQTKGSQRGFNWQSATPESGQKPPNCDSYSLIHYNVALGNNFLQIDLIAINSQFLDYL